MGMWTLGIWGSFDNEMLGMKLDGKVDVTAKIDGTGNKWRDFWSIIRDYYKRRIEMVSFDITVSKFIVFSYKAKRIKKLFLFLGYNVTEPVDRDLWEDEEW